jgi:hypothetical protein
MRTYNRVLNAFDLWFQSEPQGVKKYVTRQNGTTTQTVRTAAYRPLKNTTRAEFDNNIGDKLSSKL